MFQTTVTLVTTVNVTLIMCLFCLCYFCVNCSLGHFQIKFTASNEILKFVHIHADSTTRDQNVFTRI